VRTTTVAPKLFLLINAHVRGDVVEHMRPEQRPLRLAECSRAPLATASSTGEVTRSATARSTSEPNTAAPWCVWPTDRDLALAAKRSTKRSAIFASTTLRSVDMQICRWLANAQGGGCHGSVDVGILKDERRRLAAAFQGHRLQVLG